jgi:thiol-disulfide isomerase/thioredoxin
LALLGPVIARPGAAPAKAAAAPATPQPLVWTDVDGRGYGPTQIKAAAATVFVFGSTECPLASAYAGRLRALEQEYFAKRVSFFLVNAHPSDTADTARTWARERKLALPVVKDVASRLVDRLGATRTPEAVVVDRAGNVVYRGRIDDDKDPARVRAHHLRDALDAVLAGKTVARARIPVKGRLSDPAGNRGRRGPARVAGELTRATSRPLLNAQCVSCHREGEVAPFALDTYAQAKLWAPMLADVVKRRIMPPWKPAPGYGDFHGARALTEQEIATADLVGRGGRARRRPEGGPEAAGLSRRLVAGHAGSGGRAGAVLRARRRGERRVPLLRAAGRVQRGRVRHPVAGAPRQPGRSSIT